MQKLRRVVLDKMIEARLTALQVDMMVYLSRYQNDDGSVSGVYYRDVCRDTGMSNQSFYNVLRSLRDKGLIEMQKNSSSDWDIRILDNDCSDQRMIGKQYINTNQGMFYSPVFAKMKGPEKLLSMFFLRRCGENHGGFRKSAKDFIEDLTKDFEITKRMLILYLKKVKAFFSIGRKNNMYYITARKATTQKSTSEEARLNRHLVLTACRRLGIRDASESSIRETANLPAQYKRVIRKKQAETQNVPSIYDAIRGALMIQDEPGREGSRGLPDKLVHKVFRSLLGLEHFRDYMYLPEEENK